MKILDACCGSRMFWYDKENEDTTFVDKRRYYEKLSSGHTINVNPDIVADFTDLPFEDNEFDLIVFDPPHLINAGNTSWLVKKYGKLDKQNWSEVITKGFSECNRVLKDNGTLVFKWNDSQIHVKEILKVINRSPLFGDKRGATRWLVFTKEK
nr:MAG TPA: Methyltransferase domain [Caudoviricetes sp.]